MASLNNNSSELVIMVKLISSIDAGIINFQRELDLQFSVIVNRIESVFVGIFYSYNSLFFFCTQTTYYWLKVLLFGNKILKFTKIIKKKNRTELLTAVSKKCVLN